MLAVSSLAACGWRTHSLQQDGTLAERGLCLDGRPALPLLETNGGGALETVERAIYAATGLRMRMRGAQKGVFWGPGIKTELQDTLRDSTVA